MGSANELTDRVEGLIDKAELQVKQGAHFDARMMRALLFRRYGKYSETCVWMCVRACVREGRREGGSRERERRE